MYKYPSREYFLKEYVENGKTREQLAKENNVSIATIKSHLYSKNVLKPQLVSYEVLREMYVKEKKTIKEIALLLGHDRNAIARAICSYSIQKENHYVQYDDTLDDDWIFLYVDCGLSTLKIAQKYGVSHGTVKKHLLHCGVTIRSFSAAQRQSYGKAQLSEDLFDFDKMYNLYIVQRLSLKDLSEIYDYAPHAIREKLVALGIPIRDISESKIGVFSGDKHPNWRGGLSTLTQRLREYHNTNLAPKCKERDGYQCQLCGSRSNLHSHHIVPFNIIINRQLQAHPDLDPTKDVDKLYDIIVHDPVFLDSNNLITYCKECHLFKIHGYKKTISSQAS